MRIPNRRWLYIALTGLMAGCAGESGRPSTFPVRGTVTYRDRPVAGATVAFLAPGAPDVAVGTTDGAGHFRLTTFAPNDGAVAGVHVVTVRQRPAAAATATSKTPEVNANSIEQAMEQAAADVAAAKKALSQLPPKYANRNTSDLRLKVEPRENSFEITLRD